MAGNYPDAPGVKFQYDRDGSVMFVIAAGDAVSQVAESQVILVNNEATNGHSVGNFQSNIKYGVIFPELRDLAGYYIAHQPSIFNVGLTISNLQTSPNSTTGLDGTWTTVVANPTWFGSVTSTYRSNVSLASVAGIKAVRFNAYCPGSGAASIYAFHLYGSVPFNQTPNRLTLWHPTLDQELSGAGMDFGNVARSTTPIKEFRVKNLSPTLTANNIVLTTEALTDTTPTVLSALSLNINDGSGYSASKNIGALTPGSISNVCTLQVAPGSSATLSIWRQRLKAAVGTWS